jgi:hypothetical protein
VSRKSLIWIGMTVGSLAGGYVPVLWGADMLSISSIAFSGLGGIAGIWFGYRYGD